MIKETGYCWNCGRKCEGLFCVSENDNDKCKQQYERKQDKGSFGRGGHSVRRGKKDNYGLAGSL